MIETRVNLASVHRALEKLGNVDLRPAWVPARRALRKDVREHRDRREGPGGAWASRASSTQARAGQRGRARRPMGRLPTATYSVTSHDRLALRSRARWSDVHQRGGTVGHGARLPARPFLWASPAVVREIATAVERHLDFVWEAAGGA